MQFDKDGSGYISRAEMATAMNEVQFIKGRNVNASASRISVLLVYAYSRLFIHLISFH